jgi:hypothetical protein
MILNMVNFQNCTNIVSAGWKKWFEANKLTLNSYKTNFTELANNKIYIKLNTSYGAKTTGE